MADKDKIMKNDDNENASLKSKSDFTTNENEMNEDQRVKILSPGMLVIKRFIRNRLAIVGTIILVAMMIFSFVGGLISPYKENQTFYEKTDISKDYASASLSTSYSFYYAEGVTLESSLVEPSFLKSLSMGDNFATDKKGSFLYTITEQSEGFYTISRATSLGSVTLNDDGTVNESEFGAELQSSDKLQSTLLTAIESNEDSVEVDGNVYSVISTKKNNYTLCSTEKVGVATNKIISLIDENEAVDYEFVNALEAALAEDKKELDYNGDSYRLEENESFDILYKGESEFACISEYSMNSESGEPLTIEMRTEILKAITAREKSFEYEGKEYTLKNKDKSYTISTLTKKELLNRHAAPSKQHLLGTDKDGMDNLTRLMYGGRISLFIGFIVVIIELFIGIILGGMAGYFGGWVDNLIMRLVDIAICIPAMPIYIILGSIMDTNNIDAQFRIFYLMLVLGILSWPGIARMVRGQILSLREQEFMIATEATGIAVRRRIFRHLIPNVIPQLIVIATMDLGSIILTEATLSFLGLGVKFPYASWGNIINAVNDSFVMTHYWYEWIPAGFLILLTVLGFNFVGDGLRDAFDPKMKR
ncbi:MAG: ABC transporter permease [Clostridia bacterium]|nr:ABC transporter permease [Clostridia bacterium]